MRKVILFIVIVCFYNAVSAQAIQAIFFNLYTDSLKKEVHNYINVEGKLTNGQYIPLDSTTIQFSSNYGKWIGNNLIIDTNYKKDSVVITAVLKQKKNIFTSITVYLKKNNTPPILKSEKEILEGIDSRKKKKTL
ncbi:MAG: hypothetical protein KF781_00670 [Chitinophagaceae bacterium]|nr:hypothetical protein [Chitinophagaceae bacterium]MCW5905247.1 hypothetical protein [Chitinophagaceae bacterium]